MKLPSHFYAIVDPSAGHEPVELAHILLDAGARILQLRLKETTGRDFLAAAIGIARMCRQRGATFIVNDRIDIAMLSDADGVHLGQKDLPLQEGRRDSGGDWEAEPASPSFNRLGCNSPAVSSTGYATEQMCE